jgi:serine/threonine-protein kinase
MPELPDRYEIYEQLGSGSHGDVFRAMDNVLQRQVVLKTLRHGVSEKVLIRFQQEARVMGRLGHRNIASVLDFGVDESGKPYLVMDWLEAVSLKRYLEMHGPLEPLFAIDIALQILSALSCAHERGVLHRDIKPSNVLLTETFEGELQVKLIDFGIAKLEEDDFGGELTKTGDALGTPLYMSP